MKAKKVIGSIVLITILFMTICTVSVTSNAANEYTLGITNVREQNEAYAMGVRTDGTPQKKIWKIVSYGEGDTIDRSKEFYCLKAEHGFFSNSTSNVSQIKKTYNDFYDMKAQASIVQGKLDTINENITIDASLKSATYYNKIMWIIDHMYLKNSPNATVERQNLLTNAGITGDVASFLTDNDIEVTQQLALWYFTNPNNTDFYHINSTDTAELGQPKMPALKFSRQGDTGYVDLSSVDVVTDDETGFELRKGYIRQNAMEKLYRYLINTANANASYTSQPITSPITLNKTNFKIEQSGERFIVGPVSISIDNTKSYNITEALFKDQSENTIQLQGENKLLNSQLQVVNSGNINEVINEEFYISLPLNTQITKVSFSIKATYDAGTTATFYTTNELNKFAGEQPVVLVERGDKDYSDEVQKNMPGVKYIDLALRKFITKINDKAPQISRVPVPDLTKLISGESTTATYNHTKEGQYVKPGDIITYTIRVYNEGQLAGFAEEITDHLPMELEFLSTDEDNLANGWHYDENDTTLRTIKTNHLSSDDEDNLIEAFNGTTLKYKDVTVKCKVKSSYTSGSNVIKVESGDKITNIAEISKCTDEHGNEITANSMIEERDSIPSQNLTLPDDQKLPEYTGGKNEKNDPYYDGSNVLESEDGKYYPGQEDDDDFEMVEIQIFDLALRKFITAIDNTAVSDRIPNPIIGADGNIKYVHTKEPKGVKTGNVVTYTLRIFNEGDIAGYATEITDDLPEGLLYLPENEINKTYKWAMIDKDGKVTNDVKKAVKVTTNYLSKDEEKTEGSNLINAFDRTTGITAKNPDYKDIKIAFEVIEPNTSTKILTNTAQISEDADKLGNPIDDIDSTPGNNVKTEDDIDVEHLKLMFFDLALRKFITKVDNLDVNNRYPEPTIDENGNIKYVHTKEPYEVENGNIITYTIRVFNEGNIAGYASEITDDLPEGLVYLPENETNKEYKWAMIDKDGKVTNDVTKAVKVTTDYLKEQEDNETNLLKPFDRLGSIKNIDYKDVKIAFKVTEPNTSDRILINTAEISKDSDDDVDSTPGNNKDGEDDIDIEKVKVRYFDLALKKWVTQAIVIENGKETITNTGHTGDENPEPVVKVDLKDKKLNKVTVKFRYAIKVTNEGQVEGYVKELKDYIPEGLKFVAEDNPYWEQVSENIVTTKKIENRLLKPGESETVEIVLTWINSDKNLGLKVNVAEISKDYNDKDDTPDIDSTPDNKKPGEDDIDEAPVILSVKTGDVQIYFVLTTVILVILAGGVYLIKKYVL